ncbi:MFS transporter [Celeribacter baekdonensis]|uniref:MFS transporter n=1 Tax=Celeribacter baekdonensis TaxID=875171 RepID=UPI0026F1D707|nr:MFS transporter [Celeribacter baekdonensis]|tara:strand:+ start:7047 stop:8516 length:1470 start_codon:yes stop_codon:yes gene_type:complete
MNIFKSTMADVSQHEPRSDRWMALAVLFLASFMNLIDVSIVNVALPRIQADTGATATQLEWVAAVYVLALAVGLLPFGRFGDVFGRRRMFLWGLLGFTAASVLCGVAPDILTLIGARAAQGSFAAMMVPQVLAIVHVIFPPDEKARVFGLFGTISSLGVVAGPIIGGGLITADFAGLGWRLAFLINVPLGMVALIGAMRFVPDLETDTTLRPDWIGTGLFAGAIVLLVLPLIEGRVLGWPWWTFAALLACVPMMVGFVLWERRLSKRGLSALMPEGLLQNRPYLIRLGLVILFFSGIPGLFLVLAIFLQSGFGLSALQSGLVTTPFPVGVMLASTLTSRFGNAYLTLRIACGAALLTIGMIGLRVVINGVGTDLTPYLFTVPLIICGFGMGTAVMSLFQVTMSSVEAQDAGAGSGAMQAFQQVGAALGIAIAGQIFFSLLGEDEMQVGTEAASRFVHAASQATLYSMAVFAALALGLGVSAYRNRKPPQ